MKDKHLYTQAMEKLINCPPKKEYFPSYKKWILCICDITQLEIPTHILLTAKFITYLLILNQDLHELFAKPFYHTLMKQLVKTRDTNITLYFPYFVNCLEKFFLKDRWP
jgi:hypothetical protein